MYTKHEALLNAIRTAVLQRNLLVIAQQSHPKKKWDSAPFQLYQYEETSESLDVDGWESKIRDEILRELNKVVFEQECGRLKMEMFGLEEAVQIEDNEIAFLKMQIEAERNNAKMAQMARQTQLKQEQRSLSQKLKPPLVVQPIPKTPDLKDNSQFAIYPCFRVDVDPPNNPIPTLSIPFHQEKDHHKSHRQMLATYTKRSLASSQENPPNQRLTSQIHNENIEKTIPIPILKPQEENLNGITREISFLQRAWEKAASQGSKKQSRKYKKELMTLIGHFWQASN